MSTIHVGGGTTFDLLASGLPALPRNDAGVDEFTESSLAHLPGPFTTTIGGNGGNIAFAAGRLGAAVRLVTPLGDDLFAHWLRSQLAEVGVEVVEVPPRETSVNVIATDQQGRRLSLFRPVVPDPQALTELAGQYPMVEGDTLVLAGYPHAAPAALHAWARAAAAADVRVGLDIGPPTAHLTRDDLADLLPHVDVLLANEAELDGLDRHHHSDRVVAEGLVDDFGLAVVVKRGSRGATYVDQGGAFDVPAFAVGSGPTVGAGDAFDAGLVHALARGRAANRAVAFGAATAALVVARGRGVLGAPETAEVDELLTTDAERNEGGPHGQAAPLGDAADGPASRRRDPHP